MSDEVRLGHWQEIMQEITNEMIKQDTENGVLNPLEWSTIIAKEFGEYSQASDEEYREETIRIAAVATLIVESIDRGHW